MLQKRQEVEQLVQEEIQEAFQEQEQTRQKRELARKEAGVLFKNLFASAKENLEKMIKESQTFKHWFKRLFVTHGGSLLLLERKALSAVPESFWYLSLYSNLEIALFLNNRKIFPKDVGEKEIEVIKETKSLLIKLSRPRSTMQLLLSKYGFDEIPVKRKDPIS